MSAFIIVTTLCRNTQQGKEWWKWKWSCEINHQTFILFPCSLPISRSAKLQTKNSQLQCFPRLVDIILKSKISDKSDFLANFKSFSFKEKEENDEESFFESKADFKNCAQTLPFDLNFLQSLSSKLESR